MRSSFKSNLFQFCLLTFLFTVSHEFAQAQTSGNKVGENFLPKVNEAAELLSQYVAIPSVTGHENKAAQYLKNLCTQKGLIVESITDSIGSVNFAASIYPLNIKKPNIILLNHIDVVQASNTSDWTYPPFEGKIADQKVWGRGSFDNKGLAISQLLAIDNFVQAAKITDLPYNVTLLSVSGEEIGGATGSAKVAVNFAEKFTSAVVIGEGGSGVDDIKFLPPGKVVFGISVAEKGMIWLKLLCNAPSEGHSSIAGNNYAIKRLVDALYKLANTRQPIQFSKPSKQMFKIMGKNIGGLKGFALKHIRWFIFRPVLRHQVKKSSEIESLLCNKITISNLEQNNTSLNQNPQEAAAILDCRYLPNNLPEEIIAKVTKIINDTLIQVSVVRKGAVPLNTKPEYFFEELKKAVVQAFPDAQVAPILFPASSDNSYYRASGCPVYGLNPMIVSQQQIEAIHNSNEYIDFVDLKTAIEVFGNFIQSVENSGVKTIPLAVKDRK